MNTNKYKYYLKKMILSGWSNIFICYTIIMGLFLFNYFLLISSDVALSISLVLLLYLLYSVYILQKKNLDNLEFSGYGICRIDKNKGIVFINSTAFKMLGYTKEEVLGLYYHETVVTSYDDDDMNPTTHRNIYFNDDKRNRNLIFNYYEKNIQDPVCIETDYFVRKDKSKFPVEYMFNPIYSRNNKIKSIIFTFKDVTERKVMQNEILRKTKELEETNRELESFSYSVSHDLRAPLRHISGFINLLKDSDIVKTDKEVQRYIDIIVNSSKKMDELIEDLLLFSRVSRSELIKTSVNLKELVYELKLELDSYISDDRIVNWYIDELPNVYADKKMLKLALMNLLINAIKFTKNKGISEISVLADVKDKETIIKIIDNGVGFEQKYTDKIFKVFQRLHKESEFEGTGIGLANVSRIISRHKGRVWAESELDKGARFYFSLPKE